MVELRGIEALRPAGWWVLALGVLGACGPAPAKLRFEQAPPYATAGTWVEFATVVEVLDATSAQSQAGTRVSLAVAPDEAAGELRGTTEVTSSEGRAHFGKLMFTRGGTFHLVASAPGLESATSDAIEVQPAALGSLRFRQAPSQGTAGEPVSPAFEVEALDVLGGAPQRPVPPVTLQVETAPPGASVPSRTTDVVDGGVRFDGVVLTRAGSYLFRAKADGLGNAVSPLLTIAPGPATLVGVTTPPGEFTAGACATASEFKVVPTDQWGNRTTAGDGGFVFVESSSVGATLYADPNCTLPLDGGVWLPPGSTGTSVWLVDTHAGYPVFWASWDGTVDAGTFTRYTVRAGAPAKLAFDTQSVTALLDQPIRPVPSVVVQDAWGNRVLGATPAVTVAVDGGVAGATLTGTRTTTARRGRAVFPQLLLNRDGDGYQLLATSAGLAPAASAVFAVATGPQCAGGPALRATPRPKLYGKFRYNGFQLADLNGDGALDVVVAPQWNLGVVVFLGRGDGTLSDMTLAGGQGIESESWQVVPGDFDGDGNVDLLAEDSASLAFFKGNGDGTLRAGVPAFAGPRPSRFGAGDFNGDGKLDAIVTKPGSFASVLRGNGDGTFGPAVDSAIPAAWFFAFHPADLDGDGHLDVVLEYHSGSVTVMRGDGSGALQQVATISAGYHLDIADYNRDGHPDLGFTDTTATGPVVRVMLGNGDATFQPPLTTLLPGTAAFAKGRTGDFDGDGLPDIAVYQGGALRIAWGDGLGSFLPDVLEYDMGEADWLISGDLNEDGRSDLVNTIARPAGTYRIIVGLGDATRSIWRPTIWASVPGQLVCADVDDDGRDDFVVGGNNGPVGWHAMQPGATLSPLVTLDGPAEAFTIADFDSDSVPDICLASDGGVSIAWDLVDGGLGPRQSIARVGGPVSSLTAIDINRDGRLDIMAGTSSADFPVTLGLGRRRFVQTGTSLLVPALSPRITSGDVNDDGDPDYVLMGRSLSSRAPQYLVVSDGRGGLSAAPLDGGHIGGAAFADFNEDGYPDMLLGQSAASVDDTAGLKLYLSTAEGRLADPIQFPSGELPRSLVVEDFDGDGHIDVASIDSRETAVAIYRGTGTGSFEPSVEYSTGIWTADITAGDFDSDGVRDLAVMGWGHIDILRGVCVP